MNRVLTDQLQVSDGHEWTFTGTHGAPLHGNLVRGAEISVSCPLNPAAGDVRGGLSEGRDAARPPVRRVLQMKGRATGTQEAPN